MAIVVPVTTVDWLYFGFIVESVVGYVPLIARPKPKRLTYVSTTLLVLIINPKKSSCKEPRMIRSRFLFILLESEAQISRPMRINTQRALLVVNERLALNLPVSRK